MSITDTKKVDLVGIDAASDNVILTVSDHLDWSSDNDHLALLEEKLNAYLAFIESGELLSSYPKAAGRPVEIHVVGKYPLNEEATRFYDSARQIVKSAGYVLRFESASDKKQPH